MKKIALILVAVFGFTFYGFGQFQFGAGASLVLDGSFFGVQGKALYDVNETFKGSGSFSYFFENDQVNLWAIDLDVHYKLMTIGENIHLNPFAGLQIANTSVDVLGISGSSTDIGINIGASFIIPAGESLEIYAEPKFVIEGVSSLVLTAGVLF
jgi:hypothetical protein